MKKDNKKALYESIMSSVAKEVKKALNEGENFSNENDVDHIKNIKFAARQLANIIEIRLSEEDKQICKNVFLSYKSSNNDKSIFFKELRDQIIDNNRANEIWRG